MSSAALSSHLQMFYSNYPQWLLFVTCNLEWLLQDQIGYIHVNGTFFLHLVLGFFQILYLTKLYCYNLWIFILILMFIFVLFFTVLFVSFFSLTFCSFVSNKIFFLKISIFQKLHFPVKYKLIISLVWYSYKYLNILICPN